MIRYVKTANKLIQLVIIFAILFAYAMFQGGFVSWFLLYAFIPVLVYLLLLLFYPISDWQIERVLSDTTNKAGGSVTVTIYLKRKIPVPLPYLIVEDNFSESFHYRFVDKQIVSYLLTPNFLKMKRVKKQVQYPIFRRELVYQYQLNDLPRGIHTFRSVTIETGDMFGFVTKKFTHFAESTLSVAPFVKEITMLKSNNRHAEGKQSSSMLDTERANVVTSVREYLPGDRFSWIDWKTTARSEKLMTKEFDKEQLAEVLVILDASAQATANLAAFEINVSLVTGLIERLQKQGIKVGVFGLSGKVKYFPAQTGSHNQMRTAYFTNIQPDASCLFEPTLQANLGKISPDTLVLMCVSDLTEASIKVYKQLQERSKKLLLFLTKPARSITTENEQVAHQLTQYGIQVVVLNEHLLKQERLAVKL
ncbi:uncharacterized protein (DUF58 family) [Natronobacillus azotifigens]|uniref:DUF58 domain-containing protein n=1 Tax=Natronobacillus azotifigens TaxID=472978 RepID=A0A9J6RFU0_9BACI|nr:DUF58 domain-containing protein [Natronobacillus azotifigens]MCZ0704203.1 DUF58 domain-containing protein [Natronobacillus azotifigens]